MNSKDLQVGQYFVIPASELQVQVSTSGGPGGQHANKSNTRVILRWSVRETMVATETQKNRIFERLSSRLNNAQELIVNVADSRSQHQNYATARERLAELLTRALFREKPRKPTRPTRSSKEKRLKRKKNHGKTKEGRRKIRDYGDG